jgi:FtsZ-binding cell division protein ZapB
MLGIPRSRTKQPKSPLQPFLRWGRGGNPDTTGRLSELSATLDDWVELGDNRPDPTPRDGQPGTSEFADWLRRRTGYTNIAELRRRTRTVAEPYSESDETITRLPAPTETGQADQKKRIAELLNEIAELDEEADKLDSEVQSLQARVADLEKENVALRRPKKERITDLDEQAAAFITPKEFYDPLDAEFHFTPGFDPCPYPRPQGFDGLKVPWPPSTYCNSPFRKKDSMDNQGIAAWARKAIAEHRLGKTVVMVLPTKSTINFLLEAGAEFRSAGRIPWIDPKTGQPTDRSPSSNMLAILRGDKRRRV